MGDLNDIEEFNQLKVGDEVWCSAFRSEYGAILGICKSGTIVSISQRYQEAHVKFDNFSSSKDVYPEFMFSTKDQCIEYKINQLKTQITALEKFKTSDKYEA